MAVNRGIIWQGKSLIDGSQIVVIATYTAKKKTANSKTGAMVQTYILHASIDPITANRTGADYAICGNCPHRGIPSPEKETGFADNRSCYVNLGQGVNQVYKSFRAGKYAQLTVDQVRELGAFKMVRLGTYGDPAAVPENVFNALLFDALGHTGYTHQSGIMDTDKRLMISADNAAQAEKAHAEKRRTFRVIPINTWKEQGKKALLKSEILCPASEEAGKKVQCLDCLLCDGTKSGKSIAIVAHGYAKKNIKG